MGNGVGTAEGENKAAGDAENTPAPSKEPKTPAAKVPNTSNPPVTSAPTPTLDTSDPGGASKPVEAPAEKLQVNEPEKVSASAGNQPWGELHSMNEELGHFYLTAQRVVLGRHRDCTLRLQGPLISGKHCTITRQIYEGAEQIECYFLLDTRFVLGHKPEKNDKTRKSILHGHSVEKIYLLTSKPHSNSNVNFFPRIMCAKF